jgi:hypothetical protein
MSAQVANQEVTSTSMPPCTGVPDNPAACATPCYNASSKDNALRTTVLAASVAKPMRKPFASQADLHDKQVSCEKLSANAYAYTAENDPNTGVIIDD